MVDIRYITLPLNTHVGELFNFQVDKDLEGLIEGCEPGALLEVLSVLKGLIQDLKNRQSGVS